MAFWLFAGFLLFFLFLALEFAVFHHRTREIQIGESFAWTGFWVGLALLFNAGVYFAYERQLLGIGTQIGSNLSGEDAALQFFTGYLVEKSLSLDNIFVIALIFTYFQVPLRYQHRVLYWGVLGAVVFRGVMIAFGVTLIHRFQWMVYPFAALLIVTAAKMLAQKHDSLRPDKNLFIKWAKKKYPVTLDFDGEKFFSSVNGKKAITPLLLALILIGSSDILFALDSIPAILAITDDPFLIYTANIFSILGLHSLYFALAAGIRKFRYIKISLTFLLGFIGVKMLLTHHYPIPTKASLVVISGILAIGALASIFAAGRETEPLPSPIMDEIEDLAKLTYQSTKRIMVLAIGFSVLLVGVAMIILPGPAVIVIPLGLAILAGEFAWARWVLKKVKKKISLLSQPKDFF